MADKPELPEPRRRRLATRVVAWRACRGAVDGCEVSGENIEGVGEIREQWVGSPPEPPGIGVGGGGGAVV